MKEIYELATVIFRRNPSDLCPTILHKKGWETGDPPTIGSDILSLLPQGQISFTKENGAPLKGGIYKASINGGGIFVPNAQFSKTIYTDILVLVADSGRMFQSLTLEDFGSSLKNDQIFARQNDHSFHWIITRLMNKEFFQLGEFTFRNHDGVLEKN